MGDFFKKYKYGILTPGEKNSGFIYLFILFLLYLFAGIKYFSPEGIASDTKTALLPPQPTLVADDIESLIPLTETKYLDGKPVLFFSGAHQSRSPFSLLNYSNSVVFHKQGFMAWFLESFPGAGMATTNDGTLAQAQD